MKASIFVVCVMMITLLLLTDWADVVEAETRDLIVEFESDPLFDEVNDPINIDNATVDDTVIGEWRRDLGDDMPNGTYYGPLFSPALFKHNLNPTYARNESAGGQEGRFTYTMLSSQFNLNTQKIMAGASEWWVRIPVHPDSIDGYFGIVLNIFKDVDNASSVQIYGNYTTMMVMRDLRPRAVLSMGGNDYMPDYIIGYDMVSRDGMRIVEDRIYLRVNAVLEPSIDYVLSILFRMKKDSDLKTYWITAESPAGRWTAIDIAEMMIHKAVGPEIYTELLDHQITEIPLDLDWSFVFVEGVGQGGLFGINIHIPANTTLSFYPTVIVDLQDLGQYLSFCFPFISDESVNVTPQIYTATGFDDWTFENGDPYFYPELDYEVSLTEDAFIDDRYVVVDDTTYLWVGKSIRIVDGGDSEFNFVASMNGYTIGVVDPLANDYSSASGVVQHSYPQGWDYADFVIFSSNSTVNYSSMNNHWENIWNVKVELLFNDETDLTILCFMDNETRIWDWDDALMFDPDLGEGKFRYHSPLYPTLEITAAPRDSSWDDFEIHNDVWISGKGTNGQWAQRYMTPSGVWTYTHHFPQIITLSSAEWTLKNSTTKQETKFRTYWDRAFYEWGTGHYIKATYWAIKAIAQGLWDGGSMIVGKILDGLSDVWEGMKQIGEFIYTRLVEFLGMIWDFIQDAIDTIVSFWDSFKYLIAPIIMMVVISVGSRFARSAVKPREGGN